MALIIIEGDKDETYKTMSALKNTFNAVNKKACIKTDAGMHTIVSVATEYMHNEKYTDEEIDKGSLCCCSAIKNCAECPFSKEDDCFLTMMTLYKRMINRKLGIK